MGLRGGGYVGMRDDKGGLGESRWMKEGGHTRDNAIGI